MKLIKREHTIQGGFDRAITLDITMPDEEKEMPVVVFLHGFKGYKDWGAWHLVAKHFAERGMIFVKMNFSHNGINPPNLEDLSATAAFAENNFFIELSDVNLVLDWLQSKSEYHSDNISLVGHSRAGGIALISAKEQARVNKVITWAAVGDYHKYIGRWDIDKWKKDGVLEFVNSRTKQVMPIHYQFYEVLKSNEEFFDLHAVCTEIEKPVLIVHAKDDQAVSYLEAEDLHSWVANSKLLLLDSGGHTFDTKHPWDDEVLSEKMTEVCRVTAKFILPE